VFNNETAAQFTQEIVHMFFYVCLSKNRSDNKLLRVYLSINSDYYLASTYTAISPYTCILAVFMKQKFICSKQIRLSDWARK